MAGISEMGCYGCPIEDCNIAVDSYCPGYCDNMRSWIKDHDTEIIYKCIDKMMQTNIVLDEFNTEHDNEVICNVKNKIESLLKELI